MENEKTLDKSEEKMADVVIQAGTQYYVGRGYFHELNSRLIPERVAEYAQYFVDNNPRIVEKIAKRLMKDYGHPKSLEEQ
ncbi:MAG: hypothetical protein AABW90_01980 [Nanoarchaeota archaeon]